MLGYNDFYYISKETNIPMNTLKKLYDYYFDSKKNDKLIDDIIFVLGLGTHDRDKIISEIIYLKGRNND